MSEPLSFDAVVIGSGAGGLCAAGLCAAARLAHPGRRTLLVENRDDLGGRTASVGEEGFLVNVGAVAIEYGGVLEETFRTVGAPFDVRGPQPATVFRLSGKTVDITRGGWKLLLDGITKKGAGLLAGMGAARKGELPDAQLTVADWLNSYTRNR